MPLEPTATSFVPSADEATEDPRLEGAAVAVQETGDVVTAKTCPQLTAATILLPSAEEQTQLQFCASPLTEVQLPPAFVETEISPLPELKVAAKATSFWPSPEEAKHCHLSLGAPLKVQFVPAAVEV